MAPNNVFVFLVSQQFRNRNSATGGVQLIGEYLKPHTAVQMNKEMMVLFAQELDPTRRDGRYRAPFCQMQLVSATDGDEDGILMDGAPPPVSIPPRITRASQKGVAREDSSEDTV